VYSVPAAQFLSDDGDRMPESPYGQITVGTTKLCLFR
jgi:hypothetical protein